MELTLSLFKQRLKCWLLDAVEGQLGHVIKKLDK